MQLFFSACSLFFLCGAGPSFAEDVVTPIETDIARNPKEHYLTFSYENDLIGNGDDKFYTSGIQFNYFNVNRHPPKIMHRIAQSWLGYDVGSSTATYYTLGQKIFTPADITVSGTQPNGRPWAGWLYGSTGLVNGYDDHVDQFGLTVGVIGPPSLAEPTQKFIHEYITDSEHPEGWDNQLHTEIGVNLSWDRRWLQIWEQDIGAYQLQFEPNVSGSLGNVSTFVGAGGTLTFGPHQKQLQDTPPRLPPALPGTGYFIPPQERAWDWYLFAGLNGRVVLRDIFLDGNTFRDSASVDKKNFVADANVGLAFTYGPTRLSYTMVHRTREFDGQNDPSVFGSLSLTHSF